MTTATITNATVVARALRLAGVTAVDEAPTAYDNTTGIEALDTMLKGFQNKGLNLWAISTQSVTLTTAASYTLSPVRPLEILNVNFRQDGRDLPMLPLTRNEYDTLPLKTTSGIPTNFHYDRQREAAKLYVWPLLATAAGETLEITYIRELADTVDGSDVDTPSEWYDTVIYNLADRLMDIYNTNRPRVTARAAILLDDALSFDREGSVFFAGPYA